MQQICILKVLFFRLLRPGGACNLSRCPHLVLSSFELCDLCLCCFKYFDIPAHIYVFFLFGELLIHHLSGIWYSCNRFLLFIILCLGSSFVTCIFSFCFWWLETWQSSPLKLFFHLFIYVLRNSNFLCVVCMKAFFALCPQVSYSAHAYRCYEASLTISTFPFLFPV